MPLRRCIPCAIGTGRGQLARGDGVGIFGAHHRGLAGVAHAAAAGEDQEFGLGPEAPQLVATGLQGDPSTRGEAHRLWSGTGAGVCIRGLGLQGREGSVGCRQDRSWARSCPKASCRLASRASSPCCWAKRWWEERWPGQCQTPPGDPESPSTLQREAEPRWGTHWAEMGWKRGDCCWHDII